MEDKCRLHNPHIYWSFFNFINLISGETECIRGYYFVSVLLSVCHFISHRLCTSAGKHNVTLRPLSSKKKLLRFTHMMLDTFSMDFFQVAASQGYFLKWKLPKCAISQAVTSQVCHNRGAQPLSLS